MWYTDNMTTPGFFTQLFSKPATDWPLFVRAGVGVVVTEDLASEWYKCFLHDTANARGNDALLASMLTLLTDTLLAQNRNLPLPKAALCEAAMWRRYDMAVHLLDRHLWGEGTGFHSPIVDGFFVEAVLAQETNVVRGLTAHVSETTLARGLWIAAQNSDEPMFHLVWNSGVDKHLALHVARESLNEAPSSPARKRAARVIEDTLANELRHSLEQGIEHNGAIAPKRKL